MKVPALGGEICRHWLIVPFVPELNVPVELTGPETVVLFAAFGHWPPLFTHTYVAVALA